MLVSKVGAGILKNGIEHVLKIKTWNEVNMVSEEEIMVQYIHLLY